MTSHMQPIADKKSKSVCIMDCYKGLTVSQECRADIGLAWPTLAQLRAADSQTITNPRVLLQIAVLQPVSSLRVLIEVSFNQKVMKLA